MKNVLSSIATRLSPAAAETANAKQALTTMLKDCPVKLVRVKTQNDLVSTYSMSLVFSFASNNVSVKKLKDWMLKRGFLFSDYSSSLAVSGFVRNTSDGEVSLTLMEDFGLLTLHIESD